MYQLGKQFSRDERGFIVSSELVLISSLCVVGLVTGLTCLRDAVNAELGDVAKAIGSVNQSYHYTGFHSCESPKCGVHAWTRGSAFSDQVDEQAAVELDSGAAAVEVKPAVVPVPGPTLPAPPAVPAVICPPEAPVLSAPYPSIAEYSSAPVYDRPVLSSACPCESAAPASACGCPTVSDVGRALPCPLPAACGPAPCGLPLPGSPQVLVW